MYGKSCVVVLVGSETANRPWVIREIVKGWDAGKGVVGIRINKLLGHDGNSCTAGSNPFDEVGYGNTGKKLSSIARSEEHTSELQSLMRISYAVFCLKKKTK